MAKNLKQKAVSGMIWTALQKYSTMIIQFISGIILARLLTPFDYGCIGMLMIFMVLAESFIDGGFGSALIQKKRPTQEDYSTIFWWNLGMALLMYAILFVSAPAIAGFYNIPLLCDVLRVQGIILFIYAFNIVQRNQLRKIMNFKILSIITITTSIIALIVTILMAYNGFGVWALVAQNIVTAAIPAFIFWFYVKWRPRLIFSWQSFKELFGFGFYMFLTHLFNQFGQQIQGLLIGKYYAPSTMGLYSKAYGTERLASTTISQVMIQVTYPLYAEMQDNKEALANMIKNLTIVLSYMTFPLMFILLLCAKPLFIFLYSERWAESVPFFQVLCLSGLAFCLQSVNLQSISAIGKSKTMFVWTLIKRIVSIALIIAGLFSFGMKGLLIAVVCSTWFAYFVNIFLVSKYIGYKWWNQVRNILPIMCVSIIAAIFSYCIGNLLNQDLYIDGLIRMTVYLIIYISWSLFFKPKPFVFAQTYVRSIIRKRKL